MREGERKGERERGGRERWGISHVKACNIEKVKIPCNHMYRGTTSMKESWME